MFLKKCNFILFEGAHGSGKTTQAKLLKEYLEKNGMPANLTKEPYLDELKELINKYSFIDNEISSYFLLYLHSADRLAHIEYIKKNLHSGNNIISDRYLLSSCVYQQIQGMPLELIEKINFFCIEPDVTFILDVPLLERKKRLRKNNRLRKNLFFEEDALEVEGVLYEKIFNRYSNKWDKIYLIDGNEKIEIIHGKIRVILEKI